MALSEVVKSYDCGICNISKSSSLPPSSAPILTRTEEKKKSSTWEIALKSFVLARSLLFYIVFWKKCWHGIPEGSRGRCIAMLGAMLGLRNDPVHFFSGPLLETGTVPESF